MVSSLVSLISKKIIKPSILTPPTKISYKLSFVDQIMHMSIPMAFFYQKNCNYEPTHVSQLLEKSLSKLLSFYYPYAGRLNKDDANYVDCNDMGVELSHVHVHCPMSQIFRQPYTNDEHVVFPVEQPYAHMNEGNLATTQVSYFDCGGIEIGGCLSHKVGDGYTTSNFFNNWGILTRDINAILSPHFVGESIYPQSIDPSVVSTIESEDPKKILGKKFIFPVDKLNELKAKTVHESKVQNPTRLEVVSSLLYKCAIDARKANNSGSFIPSSLFQVANMRRRLNPPLSHIACGNIISGYFIETNNEKDVNYPKLVREMRKGKLNLHPKENLIISEVIESIKKGKIPFHSNDEVDNYLCSSLIAFPLYKVDFGWGRPIRVSLGTGPFNKWFYLLDNQSGGGVEVIVMLDEQDLVSHFDCGGIAIGGCLSHKIGDGCTTSNFFNNWGILTRDINATLSPHFVGESIYPQSTAFSVVSTFKSKESTCLGKKFVFPVDKLNALKAKIAHELEVQNPTRVEVLSALLYKCALVTKGVNNSGSFKPSSLFQVANMRHMLNPPLPYDTCGNILSGYLVEINNEKDINYPKLVGEMRKGKLNLHAKESVIILEVVKSIKKGKIPFHSNDEVDNYLCSSFIEFPLYKVDFGWGRPIRVGMGAGPIDKFFFLLDNQVEVELKL